MYYLFIYLFCGGGEISNRFAECGLLMQCLEELARRYPATKFVKIISTDCIPNYPDCNLPTLLVYNNGAVKANYVGLHSFGRRCTPEGMLYTEIDSFYFNFVVKCFFSSLYYSNFKVLCWVFSLCAIFHFFYGISLLKGLEDRYIS